MDTRAMPDIREIGRRLKARREELHLDQEQVADLAQMSRPYISRLERGLVPAPKITELAQVAEALQTSLVDLIRQPHGTRTERYSSVCSELVQQLEGEPPEIADAVLQAFRTTMEIARIRHQAQNN